MRPTFERSYQEFFRPAGVEHQISFALPSTGHRLTRITLNRARGDLSERDRLMLNLVRPHVARAWEQAAAFERLAAERRGLEQVAEAVDVGVVIVRGGLAAYANPRARELLFAYFEVGPVLRRRLSDTLAEWLGTHGSPSRSSLPPPRKTLVVERDGSRLEVRSLSDGDGHVLILREWLTRITPRRLEELGLTRRQAEVLAWLAQGKANNEIASILTISVDTVGRHVEAIFEKLGVQTRTAAAAMAYTHLSM